MSNKGLLIGGIVVLVIIAGAFAAWFMTKNPDPTQLTTSTTVTESTTESSNGIGSTLGSLLGFGIL